MARVTLPQGIAAIHGKIGNMVYRSRKQADGTYKVFVHEYRPPKVSGVKREVSGVEREVSGVQKKRLSKDIGRTLEGHC